VATNRRSCLTATDGEFVSFLRPTHSLFYVVRSFRFLAFKQCTAVNTCHWTVYIAVVELCWLHSLVGNSVSGKPHVLMFLHMLVLDSICQTKWRVFWELVNPATHILVGSLSWKHVVDAQWIAAPGQGMSSHCRRSGMSEMSLWCVRFVFCATEMHLSCKTSITVQQCLSLRVRVWVPVYGLQETRVCMYFNGSRSHCYEFCTSTGYLRISLVRAVSVQVVFAFNPWCIFYVINNVFVKLFIIRGARLVKLLTM